MTNTARFYMDIPLDHIDQSIKDLAEIGFPTFSPVDNMVHITKDSMNRGILTGTDGQYAIQAINQYLKDTRENLLLPTEFRSMSHEARKDLLAIANEHTQWTSGYGPTVTSIDPQPLKTFIEKYPHQDTPAPQPRPSYRRMQFPLPPLQGSRLASHICLIPGCNHNRYTFNPKRIPACWGHSFPDEVWDGLKWTTFDKALHGTHCRVGKEGGISDCNNNFTPDAMRNIYRKQRDDLNAGLEPVPGP